MSGKMTPDGLAQLQADPATALEFRPYQTGTSDATPDLAGRAARMNASAYAQGSDLHFAPGQEQHLPHEAWHVVQQRQGRVGPARQM